MKPFYYIRVAFTLEPSKLDSWNHFIISESQIAIAILAQ